MAHHGTSVDRKTEQLVLAEVESVMALARDYDVKGWQAANAKMEGSADHAALKEEADRAELALRAKLRQLCIGAFAGSSSDQRIAHAARQIVRELQDSPKSALTTLTQAVHDADAVA